MARKVNVNIEIDGKNISPIAYLAINQPLNGHHTFELRCAIQERDRLLSNAGDSCGKEIKIEFTSGSGRSGASNFFKGFVTGVSLSKHQGAVNEIIYTGYSPTIQMDDGAHNQSFEEKSLDKIVKAVSNKYGIAIKADAVAKSNIAYTVQYQESSFHFISRLANQYGEWFYYNGTDLIFGKVPSDTPVELLYGRDLNSFDLALNLVPTKFKWQSYDPLGHKYPESASKSIKVAGLDEYGKKIASASDSFFSNEPTITTPYEVQDKSTLEDLMKHQRAGRSGNFVVCNGSSDNHTLQLGSIISVKGSLGNANGPATDVAYGEFRIVKISHSTDSLGNYQNHFKGIPSSLAEPPINTMVSNPVSEPQQAEVLENHDPEGLGRVRVQFAWQKANNDKTPWIRVAASGAGGGYGAYFVPEKKDQVFVGFEHNNPDKPYILGGLYHGKAKAKDMSDGDNNKKVIQTKSGNKILMDDSGTIEILTGANVITMTKGKITIKTDADLELLAKNITIDASENLKLLGKEVTIDGTNVTITATSAATVKGKELTAEGQISAKLTATNVEVSAQAIVDIKGNAMVKLNS